MRNKTWFSISPINATATPEKIDFEVIQPSFIFISSSYSFKICHGYHTVYVCSTLGVDTLRTIERKLGAIVEYIEGTQHIGSLSGVHLEVCKTLEGCYDAEWGLS